MTREYGEHLVSFNPEDIPWTIANGNGTRSATLVGTRQPGELFTYAFFIPAGFYDAPHWHLPEIHLHVAKGLLRLGTGENPDGLVDYRRGSFLWLPPRMVHTDGADVDTVILGTAMGPWATTYVTDSPNPADGE